MCIYYLMISNTPEAYTIEKYSSQNVHHSLYVTLHLRPSAKRLDGKRRLESNPVTLIVATRTLRNSFHPERRPLDLAMTRIMKPGSSCDEETLE